MADVGPAGLIWAPLARDVLVVDGDDALSFLQGQLSQDLDGMAERESRRSFLLQPQGKVEAWVRVTRLPAGAFALDVERGYLEAVQARLQRFLLRVKVELHPIVDQMVAGIRGPDARSAAREADAEWLVADVGLGVDGVDVFTTEGIGFPAVEQVDPEVLEAIRIRAGIPAMGTELTDATIPGEAGGAIIDASVSFTKGCYVGQELVARVDSRGGNVPRMLHRLDVESDAASALAGAAVTRDGVEVGHVTSAAADGAGGTVALASIKRGTEPGAVAVVAADGTSHPGTLMVLPVPGSPTAPG